ncbi:MAG: transporter substrate-binding domain-containing protein [Vicingaceae bacterium]
MKKLCFLFSLLLCSFLGDAQQDSLNKPWVVGIKVSPPFVIEDENGKLSGISIALLNELNKANPKTIEFKKYDLQGLLLALENKEVDFSINPITVTEERLTKLEFSQPFYISHLSVVAKKQETSKVLAFIKNLFSLEFFSALFLLFVVIFIFGALVWYFERKRDNDFGKGIHGLFDGVWFSAVTMTTVGYGDKSPKTPGGKAVSLIWMFTAIIIISGFTASIAASLTVDNLEGNIKNFQELKKRNVGTIAGSSSFNYLAENNIRADNFTSIKDGLLAILDGKIDAFVYDEPLLRHELQHFDGNKELAVLPFSFNTQYYGLSFPENSPLLDEFNPELLRILKSPAWKSILENYDLER